LRSKTLLAAIAASLAGLVSVATGFSGTNATTLKGSVGPGFTISLTQGGHKVTALKQGTYQIVVSDRSPEHNFVLRGPGSTRSLSSVGATISKTVTVKLTKGTWTYFCAPHASVMHGSFRVT
jgi:plastocyanin